MIMEDTIAAIATPLGAGGVGIIRVSGPKAGDIARRLFKPSRGELCFKSHHLYHGHILAPATGAVLDEVLVAFMKKPHSYTGDDTLEINCHGGLLILENVLGEVVKAGARIAMPGEFTKRAFLNNRMDLSQAEAVADIITAKTEEGLFMALSQMKGALRDQMESFQGILIDILALLEVSIDFSEEETDAQPPAHVLAEIEKIIARLTSLLATYDQGRLYRQGVHCVITGKPNVGKSSLLNRLLGEKRAIVTPIPGTTRDFIEEAVNINGVPIKLIDTAGIREPENVIEETGIGMVWDKLATADVVIIILDGSRPLTPEDDRILAGNKNRKSLVVINKADLPQKIGTDDLKSLLPDINIPPLNISAKYGDGIPELKDRIYGLVMNHQDADERRTGVMLANIRHKTAIEQACGHLERAKENILGKKSPEFAAFDVREALTSLGAIVGKTTPEDVLDRIFSTFCIGK
ncbi:MAG: tRNA uridine-5-carboxymethylaminomethyl(34) synthesis GTPase MnmE [Deltaproteobacteria bacterium]|nr:tRNA uridine-5-carboxymethylaminomethyl(34) synthesis GTPase MnmE [Deltaproteobacteria bacterium]